MDGAGRIGESGSTRWLGEWQPPPVTSTGRERLLETFLAAADAVALARPEVDVDIAREVMLEAATMLHDGLALDGVDEADLDTVVEQVAADLVSTDPGAALRASAAAARAEPGPLHDPEAASAAYLTAAQTLGV
jgi:hypothetical protein